MTPSSTARLASGGAMARLVAAVLGVDAASRALARLAVIPALSGDAAGEGRVSRGELAMALNVLLFADVLERVPAAAAYVERVAAIRRNGGGGRLVFDHGALRSIDGETGALPRGRLAFVRILAPLGYVSGEGGLGGVYPLDRLRMTGHVYTHADFPENIPQFFVSELHVARLGEAARAAADRVFGASVDPLGAGEAALLAELTARGVVAFDVAAAGLPGLARAFGRHHPEPALADYEALLADSAEAAWIATEGNAFNHATDRVADVVALAEDLRAEGYAIKDAVEISASGRVRQTALIAARVMRGFVDGDGVRVEREVPGSFHEFISRDVDPATGGLDLRFDAGNATGIFKVTA